MAALIHAENLVKRFDQLTAVDDLNLDIAEGEIFALLGHNGAGKTTTVRMLASILRPTEGRASVAGYDVVREARQVRASVGVLTDAPGLYQRMPARDYLDFFGELYGLPGDLRRERAAQLLDEFGLTWAADRRLGEFSKGMRQKVALIRAMLHSPRVLYLDEPTSALDPVSARQVRDAIVNLRENCQTVLLCTHNLYEAEELADRIGIIQRGKILAIGTPEALKRQFLGAPQVEVQLAEPLAGAWPDLPGLIEVEEHSEYLMRYRTTQPESANPLLLSRLTALDARVVTIAPVPRSLEQVYLKLTQE